MFAVALFISCNSSSEKKETTDTTTVAPVTPVDTTTAPVDTNLNKMDTTNAADTGTKGEQLPPPK